MQIVLQIDDRLIAAGGGALASIACAAFALHHLRSHARVQAACSALLGRPTAYRLNLVGTGLELAPWERNFVGEVVVRRPPETGLYIGPNVPVRPERQGSIIRDSTFIGAPKYGVHVDSSTPGSQAEGPEPDEIDELLGDDASSLEDATARYWLPAICENGHEFAARRFARLAGRASITQFTPVAVTCPECDGVAAVRPGRYYVDGDELVRENVGDEDDEDSVWPSQNFLVTTA